MSDDSIKALEHTTVALQDITGILKKLAGPLAGELGQMLGDKVREYRMRNATKIFLRTQQMLSEAGINPRSISPRLFLPALEACSVEDDPNLQERWAALLANASDPNETNPVLPSFVVVLEQLTPEQALFLDRVFAKITREGKLRLRIADRGVKFGKFNSALSLIAGDLPAQEIHTNATFRDQAALMLDALTRLGILNRVLFDEETLSGIKRQAANVRSPKKLIGLLNIQSTYCLSSFGFALISACHPPTANETDLSVGKT